MPPVQHAPPTAAPPLRPLAALSAVVALLHLLALHLLPVGLPGPAAPRSAPSAFATRMVAPPATAHPATAPMPPSRPRPRAAQPPRAAPAAAAPDAQPPEGTASPAAGGPPPAAVPDPSAAADLPSDAPPPAPVPAATPPPPVGLPAPVRLRYEVTGLSKGLTYHARSELLWEQDGQRYDARLELSAFLIGARVQTSTGRIGTAGLLPERFSDKARSEQAAHFDYAQGRIIFSSNAPEAPLAPGAQDRLGLFLQLGALLAGDPARYPAGTAITVPTVGTRDAADWVFVVGPQETMVLPAGEMVAQRLDRAPRKDYDTRVEVWYAPALGYLPVRIRITQYSGDFVDQQLRGLGQP